MLFSHTFVFLVLLCLLGILPFLRGRGVTILFTEVHLRTPCHGPWSINRLLELAVTSTRQPCTAQGSLFSQRPSCQLQFPVANTFPWTWTSMFTNTRSWTGWTPQRFWSYFWSNWKFYVSVLQIYFGTTFRIKIVYDLFEKNFHLVHDKWSLFSLCTTNILPMINVTGLLVDAEFH